MATTFVDYTGDGNATKSFSFPSIKEADVKVEVDGVVKTTSTHYNITSYTTTGGGNVVFTSGNIPASPAAIRIFRDTDVDNAKATYTAGSSVKAGDLNSNHEQLLFAAQEEQNQTVITSDIKDGAVTSAKITDGTIVNADVNASAAIDGSKLQASSGSVAGTMSAANFTKLAGIETAATADQTNAEIRTAVEAATDSNVFTDADHSKLNTIETSATADQTIGEIKTLIAGSPLDASHLAADSVTSSELAANSVTTSEIADPELTTLAGMQSGTASKLADSTALTADIADLNQIDGLTKQTTISDSDASFPTSGAVVDYVTAQIDEIGGFEAITNEVSFPNAQPGAGVAISIADAAGIVVNGSGVSTTGRTVGGSTVTINGIASNFNGTTVASGIRFIVTSTGSGQVYNYHKATLAESDLTSLSGDINDFAERYRVGSSNPTSSLDNGDLFFNTSTGKMLVYNGTNTAWEEVQSIGNFFISTLSPAFNGSLQNFTLSDAPTNVQQILLIINGVVQKPNAGTSTPSEGFALDGSTVKLGAAPATGSTYHVVVMGSTVNVGTPSNNTVTTAILQNGSVTTAKIVDANVTTAKIADDAVTQAKIAAGAVNTTELADNAVNSAKLANNSVDSAAIQSNAVTGVKIAAGEISNTHIGTGAINGDRLTDETVTLAKLPHGDSNNNGKFLRANNGADPSFETVSIPAGTTINNQGDNRVITGSGTANTLNGESDVVINNGKLGVGVASPSQLIEVNGASNPAVLIKDTTNDCISYMYSQDSVATFGSASNHPVVFNVNNGEKVRIDSSGKVGIGTTGPISTLHLHEAGASGSPVIQFSNGDTGATSGDGFAIGVADNESPFIFNRENTDLRFGTNNTERMRINSSGKVGIGHDSPGQLLSLKDTSSQVQQSFTAATNGSCAIYFGDTDSINRSVITHDNSSDSLAFSTAATERMRITSAGQVNIGHSVAFTTSTIFNVQRTNGNLASMYHDGTDNNPVLILRHQRAGSNSQSGVQIQFNNTNGSAVGFVTSSASATNYQTSSDYRLKENAVAISDGITRLKTLKPYRFNFKVDPTTTVDGFFAHEVTAVPEAISGDKDEIVTQAMVDNGDAPSDSKLDDPIYQGIDQSKLVPLLTAALQEAITKIETLETKVAALEAA